MHIEHWEKCLSLIKKDQVLKLKPGLNLLNQLNIKIRY